MYFRQKFGKTNHSEYLDVYMTIFVNFLSMFVFFDK